MVAELTKIIKSDGSPVDEIEKTVALALKELEATEKSITELYIVGAKEIEFVGKKCIIIYVPVPQLKQFQKIQIEVARNLEKKFGGTHVVFIAKRRILAKPQRGKKHKPTKQVRTRSRTLTTVHEAILNDMVYPAEVVGKRIRVKLDGKKLMKVHLDKAQENTIGYKIETFTSVYKALTGKDAVFEFQTPLL
uniref:40S ribosomal protein S7 n=1 Tax=Rhabditophanes sp. KR3021 TaxID=114890 RepID=A0AC35U9W5_9BILA